MSVIITGIDMPKSCFECDKTYKWKKDGKVQCPHINMPSISNSTTNRPSYCPLKEYEERPSAHWIEHLQDIKAEIEDEIDLITGLGDYHDLIILGLKSALNIINKHISGKEQK